MTGRLVSTSRFTVAAVGPAAAPGQTPVQGAVLAAAGTGRSPTAVRTDGRVHAAMDAVATGIQRSGLMRTPAQVRTSRAGVWPLAAVLLVGVGRLASAGSHPVGHLVAALVVIAIAILVLVVSVTQVTSAGSAALSSARAANRHLSTGRSPSWTAYGPGGLAMSVADAAADRPRHLGHR